MTDNWHWQKTDWHTTPPIILSHQLFLVCAEHRLDVTSFYFYVAGAGVSRATGDSNRTELRWCYPTANGRTFETQLCQGRSPARLPMGILPTLGAFCRGAPPSGDPSGSIMYVPRPHFPASLFGSAIRGSLWAILPRSALQPVGCGWVEGILQSSPTGCLLSYARGDVLKHRGRGPWPF